MTRSTGNKKKLRPKPEQNAAPAEPSTQPSATDTSDFSSELLSPPPTKSTGSYSMFLISDYYPGLPSMVPFGEQLNQLFFQPIPDNLDFPIHGPNVIRLSDALIRCEFDLPGLLVLLCSHATDFQTIRGAMAWALDPAVLVTMSLVFGYPMGVVLRLLKTHGVDECSRWLNERYRAKNETHIRESFFYVDWLQLTIRERLPLGAAQFFDELWADKGLTKDPAKNTTFFNFCKSLILKCDQQCANEVYYAEAFCHFVSGSFYALAIAFILMLVDAFLVLAIFCWTLAIVPLAVGSIYFFLLVGIALEFRHLRCKEVMLVFSATFANRDAFDKLLPTATSKRCQ